MFKTLKTPIPSSSLLTIEESDLSVLDLLKNHIFREATIHKQDEIQYQWTTMLARLGGRRADAFIKVFWTARFGRIQRGRLFKELRVKYATKTEVVSLSKDLAAAADVFANLEVADSDIWKPHAVATRECVKSLALLGGRQTHPILMAGLSRFPETEVEKLLKRLVTLIVRYQVIGRGRTGRLEIEAAAIAKGIWDKTLKSAGAVWSQILGLVLETTSLRKISRDTRKAKRRRLGGYYASLRFRRGWMRIPIRRFSTHPFLIQARST